MSEEEFLKELQAAEAAGELEDGEAEGEEETSEENELDDLDAEEMQTYEAIDRGNLKSHLADAIAFKMSGNFDRACRLLKLIIMKGEVLFGSPVHYELASYYYTMGDFLMEEIEAEGETKGAEAANNQPQNPQTQAQPNPDPKADPMLGAGVDLESIRTAWENLETARHILQTRLETAELGEEERRSLVNRLAIVFVRLGDCEAWQDKFKEAIEAYSHSASLREQIENPQTSRGIAEVYFMIANTLGYMPEAPLSALDYYQKAADILHQILLDKYEKLGVAPEPDRERILQDRAQDDDSVKEIKSILHEMRLRIEDARLEEVERERYLQAKRTQEAENRQALNAFGKPVLETEEVKVKNLGFFGKKPAPAEAQQALPAPAQAPAAPAGPGAAPAGGPGSEEPGEDASLDKKLKQVKLN